MNLTVGVMMPSSKKSGGFERSERENKNIGSSPPVSLTVSSSGQIIMLQLLLLLLAMSLRGSSLEPSLAQPASNYHHPPPSPLYYGSPPMLPPPHGILQPGPRYTPPPSPMFYRSPPPPHGHGKHKTSHRKHGPRPPFYRSTPPPYSHHPRYSQPPSPMFYRSPPPPLFYLSPPPPYSHGNHAPRYAPPAVYRSPPPPYYHRNHAPRYTPPPCYAVSSPKLVVEGNVVCPNCPQIPDSKSSAVGLPSVKAVLGGKSIASYGYSGDDGKFRVMLSGVQLGKVELKQCQASSLSSSARTNVCYKQVRTDAGKSFTLASVMLKEIIVHAGTFELEPVSCT